MRRSEEKMRKMRRGKERTRMKRKMRRGEEEAMTRRTGRRGQLMR